MALPQLSLRTVNYPVGHYVEQRSSGDPKFDLDAPYQRASVWTVDQRRALIKSLLMGLPIGAVVFAGLPYQEGRASFRVLDGKQRIEAVRAFFAGEFDTPRDWWRPEYVIDGHGGPVTWHELTQPAQRHIGNRPFPGLEFDSQLRWVHDPDHPKAQERGSAYYPLHRTEEQMLVAEAEVYLLLNSGGTGHTDQDIERAAAVASSL